MTSLNELDNDIIRIYIWNTYEQRHSISSTAQIEDITARERNSFTKSCYTWAMLEIPRKSDNMWYNVSIAEYYDIPDIL